jgi:hypothetical protein
VDDESDNREESVSITQGLKLVVSELVSDIASKDSLKEGIELLAKTSHPEAISVIKQVLGPFHNHEYSDPDDVNDWGYEPSAWTHKITGRQVPSYTTHAFEPAIQALGRIGNRKAKELLVRFLNDAHYPSGYPDAYPKAARLGHVVRALSKKPSEQDEWLVPHIMKYLPSFYDMIDESGQYISTEALTPMLSILVPFKPEGLFDTVLDILQNLYRLKERGNEEEIWEQLMHLELNAEELASVIDYLKEREMGFINPFGRAGPPKGRFLETPKYPDVSFLTLIQSSEEYVSEDLLAELDDIRLTSERKRWWEDSSIYASFEKEMLGRFIDYCRSRERNSGC